MKREFCDGETAVRKNHWHRGKLSLIEHVEAEVCQEGGERYYHARTLDKLDALVQEDPEVKQVLSVEVLTA